MGAFEVAKSPQGTEENVIPVETTNTATADAKTSNEIVITNNEPDLEEMKPIKFFEDSSAAGRIEAIQAVWGAHGKKILIAGLAMMMIMYEFDNTTIYTYYIYAQSNFNQLSSLAALGTAGSIIFAVVKPLMAKISDVVGRGEMYLFIVFCYILSYILCASSSSYPVYATGYIFHTIGQSSINTMNDIIIADISTARWRGFAIGISFFPFLIMPWVSGFVVESVVNGIGWRWGIGMLAILLPFCASFIVFTLFYFQRKARNSGLVIEKRRVSFYEFFSLIDAGGLLLLMGGFSLVLLPLTLASGTPDSWRTPWVPTLIAVGCVLLVALPFYEKHIAVHPVVPFSYFKNLTITMALLLITMDSIAFSCTHTYLYTWAIVAQNYSVRNATFLNLTNGIMQCLVGIITGLIMYKTRSYKWLVMGGVVIRLIGYGIMLRLRQNNTTDAELFVVQLVQGIGSGIIQTAIFVAATVAVVHGELAQMTSLVLCCSFLGSSIGSAIAGGIYTGTFRRELAEQLGTMATPELVESLYQSITGVLPLWGSVQREAVDQAYSNVLGYTTYAAFAAVVPSFVFAWFLPNAILTDTQNLVETDRLRAEGQ